ncbi:MAG: FAD-dependent monooxygenase [Proteobacteria bacterium]|nr:FAD-dependent monooxygenase [Pseudomonadota bacterium]
MQYDAQVVIAGAGPGGAALGYLLASRGIDTLLLDRQLDFEREFRGEMLMPGGLDALAQMGVGLDAAFASVPRQAMSGIELYLNQRRALALAFDDRFPTAPPTAVSQPALLEALVEAGRASGRLSFHPGTLARSLVSEAGRVVGIEVRTPDGPRTFRAPLVVGSDGRASVVRRAAGLMPERQPQRMDVVWCKLPLPDATGGGAVARGYVGRGHLLLGYRSWDDQLQVAWVIQKGSYGDLKRRGMDEWVDTMAEHASADWAEHFRRHRADFTRPFLLDAALDCAPAWSAPGVLLLGDAAHTMSPVGAQGLNVALRDAVVAANHLVPVLQKSHELSALDEAAARVEAERRREIEPVQALQERVPRVVLGRGLPAACVRQALALLLRLGGRFAGARLPRPARNLLAGVTDVQLRV